MDETLRDPLLLLLPGGVRHNSAHSGEQAGSKSRRQSPCMLKLAQERGTNLLLGGIPTSTSAPAGEDDSLLIRHTWNAFRHRMEFWLNDQFHVLMSMPFRYLVVALVVGEALFALFLASTLFLMTWGDVQGCLGDVDAGVANYYYFAIETMFTIGFGAPRHPSCTAANIWTSIAVLFTNVVHGCVVGIVFSKFSSGATRRYALAFSPSLLGTVTPARAGRSPASASTKDNSQREWRRLHSNSYSVTHAAIPFHGVGRSETGCAGGCMANGFDYTSPSPRLHEGCSCTGSCKNCGNIALAIDIKDPFASSQVPPQQQVSTQPALPLEDFEGVGFSLSFRLMNLTECAFFDPKLSIFLMKHDSCDLMICQLNTFYTDMPLQFLELPLTVTIGDQELREALGQHGWPMTISDIVHQGDRYELLVLISFVDNQSSRLMELRKSWKLSQVQWGYSFQKIVRRTGRGVAYQVDVECLDNKTELMDTLNLEFSNSVSQERLAHDSHRVLF